MLVWTILLIAFPAIILVSLNYETKSPDIVYLNFLVLLILWYLNLLQFFNIFSTFIEFKSLHILKNMKETFTRNIVNKYIEKGSDSNFSKEDWEDIRKSAKVLVKTLDYEEINSK